MILGPRLDGSVAGTAVIRDTDGGALDLDPTYDRAVGPMQFLPGTWRLFASDGNADGRSDPHNVYDAALAAGRYLCASGGDLRTPTGLATAVLSYNYSTTYLSAVLAWGLAYRDGVWSTALSPGSVPPPPPEQPAPTASTAPPQRPRRHPHRPAAHRATIGAADRVRAADVRATHVSPADRVRAATTKPPTSAPTDHRAPDHDRAADHHGATDHARHRPRRPGRPSRRPRRFRRRQSPRPRPPSRPRPSHRRQRRRPRPPSRPRPLPPTTAPPTTASRRRPRPRARCPPGTRRPRCRRRRAASRRAVRPGRRPRSGCPPPRRRPPVSRLLHPAAPGPSRRRTPAVCRHLQRPRQCRGCRPSAPARRRCPSGREPQAGRALLVREPQQGHPARGLHLDVGDVLRVPGAGRRQ